MVLKQYQAGLCKILSRQLEKQLSLPELEGKNLIDTYGINSLIALEIIIDIEKEFGIFIEDEEELIRAFSSIDDLAALVRKYKE